MRYFVYWKNMLKEDKGDAPMRAFDTTIEAKAYIRGFVDSIVTFVQGEDEEKVLNEFKIKDEGIHEGNKS